MDRTEDSKPRCAIKCFCNVKHVCTVICTLKYGVNTVGRGLHNDIIIQNLNVSRNHCHLRVEKKGSKDIAFIKDLGTSNGTIIGNINLVEFEEHQLNDLDMIVLANNEEGTVLQFTNRSDRTISSAELSNNQMNNKRKVPSVEYLDEPSAVKLHKLSS